MSTAPLRMIDPSEAEEPEGRPLGRRGLWLLPFLGVAAFGLGIPVYAVELAPRLAPAAVRPEDQPRVPYGSELSPLLEREDLDLEVRKLLRSKHDSMLREAAEYGGITEKDAAVVRRLLERYR